MRTDIIAVAKQALTTALAIKRSDRVLVLTDRNKQSLAEIFYRAAQQITNTVDLALMAETGQHGKEPTDDIAARMLDYDVIIAVTTYSLTHTHALRRAKQRARIASLPDFTAAMFGALAVDYDQLKSDCLRLADVLQHGNEVRITTLSGTDLTFSIEGCQINPSYGIVEDKGVVNLPDGEVFLPPKEMNGALVIDFYPGIANAAVMIHANRIVRFSDTEGGTSFKELLSADDGALNVAEFGIGTNKSATLIGNILMDEKVLGTAHVAFGNNLGFGGTNNSSIHIDVILMKPTIVIDGNTIMKDGDSLW